MNHQVHTQKILHVSDRIVCFLTTSTNSRWLLAYRYQAQTLQVLPRWCFVNES